MLKTKSFLRPQVLLIGAVFLLWAIMMFAARHLASSDTNIQATLWDYRAKRGFHGIGTINAEIGANYTVVWYFIIVIFTKLHLYPHFAIEENIKMLAIGFTIASSITTYFITKHLCPNSQWRPTIAALLILFMPAFFCDIIKTNLPDASYLTFCLLAVLALLKKRYWLVWFLIGVAMSFKMMGVYIVPFLLYLYARDFRKATRFNMFAPLFAVVGYLICSLPGLLVGQGLYDVTVGTVMQRSDVLNTTFAANFWTIFGGDYSGWQYFPSVSPVQTPSMKLFAYSAVLLVFIVVYILLFSIRGRRKQQYGIEVLLVVSPLICYFFMPAQHEGYFALAPVLAMIVWVVHNSRLHFWLFIILSYILWCGYHGYPYVLNTGDNSIVIAAIIGFLVWTLYRLTPFYRKLEVRP
jgi:hypothetical protein